MAQLTLFGIKNCDTVTKARKWLTENHHDFIFYDYKKDPVTPALLTQFLTHFPLDVLINKRGTTWRTLSDDQKRAADTPETAIELMIAMPSMIKRPILARGEMMIIGFRSDEYTQFFASPSHD